MTRARDLANLLDATGDVIADALDNAPSPTLTSLGIANHDQVTVNANGVLSTSQPAVWLTNRTESSWTSGTVFTGWYKEFEVGSNYSNGVFTCPVSGVYQVFLHLWRNSNTQDYAIRLNGSSKVRIRNSTTNDHGACNSVVFNCSANDTIDALLHSTNGGIYNGGTGYSNTLMHMYIQKVS